MAIGRKTGGRQKGVRNKRTEALIAAAQRTAERMAAERPGDFEGDAHALLMSVYKNTELLIDLRVEAAGKALPYEKPRLASVELGNRDPEGLIVKIVRYSEMV